MRTKVCSVCGDHFGCGSEDAEKNCWCNDLPPIMPLDFTQDCRCPKCLKVVVKEKIEEYVATITPENALNNIAKGLNPEGKSVEGIDYYI